MQNILNKAKQIELVIMDDHKINSVLVTDADNRLIGALNMHDLLRAGVV